MSFACCTELGSKRSNSNGILIECFFCKRNFHAECLDILKKMSGAINNAKMMARYPGLFYMCKQCRDDKHETVLDLVRSVNLKVDFLKDEISQMKLKEATNVSWASMAKDWNKKISKPVMIINSKNDELNSGELKKMMKQSLKNENVEIINTMPAKKNKGLVVVCENEEEKKKVFNLVQQKMNNCEVKEPVKNSPRVKILNVELEDDENNAKFIIDELKKRNKIFDDVSGIEKIVFVTSIPRKYNGKIVANKYNIICSVDSATYNKLIDMQRIKFGYQQCRVVDGTHVTRCFKCFGFFHKSTECPKNDENICIKCGGVNHKKDDCINEMKCNNCVEFKKKNKATNIDVNHLITDTKCPCYQKALKAVVRSIDM